MTRRLVKLKKSAKEVVLLKNTEEPKVQQRNVESPSIENLLSFPIDDEVRAASVKEGILIGPQDFDPGVEKLNALKGEIEIKPGPSQNVTVQKSNNNIVIDTKDTGVLSINNKKGDITIKADDSSNIKIAQQGNTFIFGDKTTYEGVTSIKVNDRPALKNDIKLCNGDNIEITVDSTDTQKILISSLPGAFVKTLWASTNRETVHPDAAGNINITAGTSGNLSVTGIPGGIAIDVANGSIIIKFTSLEPILRLDPVPKSATVKNLRETVNSIIEYLQGFYRDNNVVSNENNNSTP